jgi:hypothetical protein
VGCLIFRAPGAIVGAPAPVRLRTLFTDCADHAANWSLAIWVTRCADASHVRTMFASCAMAAWLHRSDRSFRTNGSNDPNVPNDPNA